MADEVSDRAARWPAGIPVTQVRFARPTSHLEEVVHFYRDCLGLEEVYRFEDHAGYDGVMLGLPGSSYHLEFTRSLGHVDVVPTPENLLVLYLGSSQRLLKLPTASPRGVISPSARRIRTGRTTTRSPSKIRMDARLVLMPEPGL